MVVARSGIRSLCLLLRDERWVPYVVARVPCLASHYPGGGSRHVCSLIIQELAAACLANMLCGVDGVRHAVLRLGGDRILREFLTSPTATVQVRGFRCVYRCMAPLACVFHS